MKLIFLLLFLVDRLLKLYFVDASSYVINQGIAFGVISENPVMVVAIHVLFTCLLVIYLYFGKLIIWERYSILLIILGSISNLFDRFMYNGVVDYIGLWKFPKFNLADIMVVLGAVLLIFLELNEYYKNYRSRKIPRG